MATAKDTLSDYTSPIRNFSQICFICVVVSFGSGFIHRSISIIVATLGYSLIVARQYRFDKRRGLDPLAFSGKHNKPASNVDYNTQEIQLATLGGILFVLSIISGGIAPYMGDAIERAILAPLFG